MGGALVSTLSVLLVSWLVGSAVETRRIPLVTEQVQNSRILRTVDRVMPDPAQTWFSTFRRIVDQSAFPQVFSGLGTSEPAEVAEPDPSVLNTEELRRASQSVVKVLVMRPPASVGSKAPGSSTRTSVS